MTRQFDVAVIGAGPAGLAAATEAAQSGLSVALLDEQPAPGGQIYRGIETASALRLKILGADYAEGRPLVETFRASGAEYMPGSLVWNVTTDKVVEFSRDGASSRIRADAIIAATGALERPSPLPGWTLPGVTTAGALQILLKASGIVQEDAVLAGSGPLLWLLASQMVDAGVPPRAIVETVPNGRLRQALPHLPKALWQRSYLFKGLSMVRKVRRTGVPIYKNAIGLVVEGATFATALNFTAGGKPHRIETRTIALHQGVVPNQQVTRLLRCDHAWDSSQHCFRPVTDAYGATSVDGVYVAGDGAGIGGAKSAALQGRLVAIGLAVRAGRGNGERRARLHSALAKDGSVRPFLETLYAPAPQILSPADDTLVCRCEEVTAGSIREAVRLGAPGPNQVKSFLRAGMGPCQGRVCGLAVSAIISEERGETPDDVGYYRIRPPLKPLLLSEIANFATPDAQEHAVE